MKTVDDRITIGFYRACPYTSFEDPLDVPFVIQPGQVDRETRSPARYHAVPALQAGGGRVLSREPTDLEIAFPSGGVEPMVDSMMQLVFDMKSLSTPNIQLFGSAESIEVSEALRLPEVSGQDPMGLLCGAIGPEEIGADQPLIDPDTVYADGGPMASYCCKNRGDDRGSPYRYCDARELTDECDSQADVLRQGCSVCIDTLEEPPYSGFVSVIDSDGSCELMKSDPDSCYAVINGIDYDVDTDGDGVNDSWSVLFGFDAIRTRIYDIASE